MRVIPLCRACGYDPKGLMLTCMREYLPETLDAIEELTGRLGSEPRF